MSTPRAAGVPRRWRPATAEGAVPPTWSRAADGAVQRQDGVDVLADLVRERPVIVQWNRVQRYPAFPRLVPPPCRRSHGRSGTAPRDVPGSRPSRSRRQNPASAAVRMATGSGFIAENDARHCFQAVAQYVGGIEERRLVLLVVPVVRQRLTFHQHEQCIEVADGPDRSCRGSVRRRRGSSSAA